MAELQFQAPLASEETEDWNEYHDFQTAGNKDENCNTKNILLQELAGTKEPSDISGTENFVDTFSGSLEDLVNTFDKKITNCFCDFEENVDKFAPVQIRTQEEIMSDCQMWWTITGNFGNILPIDWSKTYTRQLHTKVLNLREKRDMEPTDLDLSEDEELAQAFDMHSLIIHSMQPEDSDHIASADEVISEIETMMEEPNLETESLPLVEMEPPVDDAYTKLKETLAHLPKLSESDMKEMSTADLNAILSDYEMTIRELNETLVTELALRDELEYDKELKNQFISLLLTIQKKRREHNLDKKRKKGKPNLYINNNAVTTDTSAGMYLTTVIPYYPHLGPPPSEQLQIYIKILQAINEDSSTVPTLLTDFILKVLCPT